MVSQLKERDGNFYCSNCRVFQPKLKPFCLFCGDMFGNFNSVLTELMRRCTADEISQYLEDFIDDDEGR